MGNGYRDSFDRSSGVMIERVKYPVVQQTGALNLSIIDVGPDFCLLLLKRPDG
ncbi:permease component [Pseudomonas syringae pv. actinidiae]|uniref:Permease component n=1 Tax=Pseudomonas syringae pv. actinidiae TaxID=103796 RepID=A0A2V0QI67_PSESF|nr:permease component [Pseudomonas syringae pv. actinidiae]GBH18146.1 permease component [Pseudomonas syringae pv. actinidiae]